VKPSQFFPAACLILSACSEQSGNPLPDSTKHVTPHASIEHETEISAQVVHLSAIPDPKKAEYANCRAVIELRVLEIHAGKRCEQHLLVSIPVLRERKLLAAAGLKIGELIRLRVTPKAATPGARISMYAESDDIQDFYLPLYYGEECRVLKETVGDFSIRSPDYFAASPIADFKAAIAPHKPYPVPPEASEQRDEEIARGTESIRVALAARGGDWPLWAGELSAFHADLEQQRKAGGGIIRRGNRAFSRLPHDAYERLALEAQQGASGPLPMLKTLNEQLRNRGIDLIVVPFPHKDMVAAGHFSDLAPKDGIYSPWRQKFLLHLLEADIEVVDLVPLLQKNEARHPLLFYDAHDLHPADGAIQIAAEEIARRLMRYELMDRPGFLRENFQLKKVEFKINENLQDRGFPENARYHATQVYHESGSLVEIGAPSACPVVIMGDSFTTCPAPDVPGASLPAHLARHLGQVPCQLLRLGSSHKTMRTLAKEGPQFFSGRCAVVFVFGPGRLFGNVSRTEGGGWDLYDLPPLRLQ
jgi:hypothetical protein